MMVSGAVGATTGVTLKDARSQDFRQLRVESMSTNFAPWAITQEMTIVFAPGKTHGPPVQLVYTAPRRRDRCSVYAEKRAAAVSGKSLNREPDAKTKRQTSARTLSLADRSTLALCFFRFFRGFRG